MLSQFINGLATTGTKQLYLWDELGQHYLTFFKYFDPSEMRCNRAKITLVGQHDWPWSENYFEP